MEELLKEQRGRNPNIHQSINKDTLANTRMWIVSTKKFTDIEPEDTKNFARQTTERQSTESHRDHGRVRTQDDGSTSQKTN